MTTSFDAIIATGTLIKGKWNKTAYRVERSLGVGANGKVYLVKKGSVFFAIKLGFDSVDLQSEINVLKQLSQTASTYRSFLIDVDDYEWQGKIYPFYVMKYIKGCKIDHFIQQKGSQWIGLLGLNMLEKLKQLHSQGFVFGDIKMDNIIVNQYGFVDLIDYGGVTRKGRSVKQFTEVYDRGYWGAGSRTADESYDLFSFATLFTQLTGQAKNCFEKSLLPQNRTIELLKDALNRGASKELRRFIPWLHKALEGKFPSTKYAYEAWKHLFYHKNQLTYSPIKSSRALLWIQAGFVASVVLALAGWYFF